MRPRAAFTLIELLIVIGILAILATVAVLLINPAQRFAESRDTERMDELQTINHALTYSDYYGIPHGAVNTVYVSIPDSSSTCGSLGLPALTAGWSYSCSTSANYRKVDGTGWLPINFTSSNANILTSLPVDPLNTVASGYYYTYIEGSWALTAGLETTTYKQHYAATDAGADPNRWEIGNNLALWEESGSIPVIAPPIVLSASPAVYDRGSFNKSITITGTGFDSGAVLSFSGTGITINSQAYVSSTSLIANITVIGDSVTGARTVTVTNSDAQQGSCSNCFVLTTSTLGNLVGYWDFDEASGTVATDFSGYNNTGTLTGGATRVAGKFGGGLSFDGVNDYVSIPSSLSLTICCQQNNGNPGPALVTLSAWVFVPSRPAAGGYTIVGKGYEAAYSDSWRLYMNGQGAGADPFIVFRAVAGNGKAQRATATLPLGQWVHVLVTCRETELPVIYFDGVAQTLVALEAGGFSFPGNSGPATIGSQYNFDTNTPHEFFPGLIDEVRIYNRVLSDTEVGNLY